jgi:voltage-gated potassium channel Kch
MALTPVLASAGERLQEPVNNWAAKLARRTRRERDDEAAVLASKQGDDLVVVCGYGRVGRVVCELLDAKLQRYVVFDLDPQKATDARARGLPVFFGDLGRQEVLEYFKVGAAKIVVVATQDRRATNRVVVALRRLYPDLEIIARAENRDHQRRLNKMLGVVAMVPALPEDSRFLTLPFGGAVLRALNYDQSDVDMLIEESRRSALGIMSGSTDTLVAEEQSSMLEQLGMNDGEAAVVDVGDEAEEEPKVAA